MKRVMSIVAIALLMAGSAAMACDTCGCKDKKAECKKEAACSAEKKCTKCTDEKACTACEAKKKGEAKKAEKAS